MVVHGILKPVYFHLKHRLHSPIEKRLIKRMMQYKTELNLLMINILVIVINKVVIYSIYTIGSNYLVIYIAKNQKNNSIQIGDELVLT